VMGKWISSDWCSIDINGFKQKCTMRVPSSRCYPFCILFAMFKCLTIWHDPCECNSQIDWLTNYLDFLNW
jgi:hypothetical protein